MDCLINKSKKKKKSSEANQRLRSFQENGKVLLQDLIELCNGKSNPIKSFSATKNFHESNHMIRFEFIYRGKSWFNHNPYEDDSYNLLTDYVEECLRQEMFTKLIDPSMGDNGHDHSRGQMEAFVELAMKCIGLRPEEDKPRMIDVAKELKHIEKQQP